MAKLKIHNYLLILCLIYFKTVLTLPGPATATSKVALGDNITDTNQLHNKESIPQVMVQSDTANGKSIDHTSSSSSSSNSNDYNNKIKDAEVTTNSILDSSSTSSLNSDSSNSNSKKNDSSISVASESDVIMKIDSTSELPTTTTTVINEKQNALDELIPPADVNATIANMVQSSKKKQQIIISSEPDCPSLDDADNLTQTQLLLRLTHQCRYDRLERPITLGENNTRLPVSVFARAYIYFLQSLEAHDLQFKIHALLQLRYVDPRLVFKQVSPRRTEPIMGENSLKDALWVPHVFFANERSSSILGTSEKDVLTSVSPDGTVIISYRIQATLYCWMNLQKFPFDEQHCSTILESWMYNTSELVLHWEQKSPVTLAPELHLTEYALLSMNTNETIINADLSDLRHGAFAGNYSSLSFSVHLAREIGFYLMDYFLPSMMIVSISWVSFWLQADQSAPRIMLGTSTMLTFITLASAQGKTLPKVSYIKASEIWFLGCTAFIFGSLVEFAFVNTIWRRKKNVELKKVNSKYILKSTLTPRPTRREMGNNNNSLQKSHSCSSLDGQGNGGNLSSNYNNYLTVHSFPSKTNLPTITTQSVDDFINENGTNISINMEPSSSVTTLPVHHNNNNNNLNNICSPTPSQQSLPIGWTTMTPQQISTWIDKRSRFLFPIAFLIFNMFYWSFVSFL